LGDEWVIDAAGGAIVLCAAGTTFVSGENSHKRNEKKVKCVDTDM
jgi:hypothetical protein